MADITQQTPASEHDGFIYGLESFVFDGKELGLISNDGLDWGGDEPSTNKIWAAQKRSAPVKEIEENPGTSEIEFDLIELKPANLVQVMGGTTSKNGKKWNAPSKIHCKATFLLPDDSAASPYGFDFAPDEEEEVVG